MKKSKGGSKGGKGGLSLSADRQESGAGDWRGETLGGSDIIKQADPEVSRVEWRVPVGSARDHLHR
jgi:hypothetical protein